MPSTVPARVLDESSRLAEALARHLTPDDSRVRDVGAFAHDVAEPIESADFAYSIEDFNAEFADDVRHLHYLNNRAIGSAIAEARGYRIIAETRDWYVNSDSRKVEHRGSRDFEERLDGITRYRPLGIPLYAAGQAWASCIQLRPSDPWEVKDPKGKVTGQLKFIAPNGAKRGSGLGKLPADVNPEAHEWALDSDIPLLITEGALKGDAALTAAWLEGIEVAPVSLTGVTMGYYAAQSESNPGLQPRLVEETLGRLPLKGRVIFLAWDSDWRMKTGVFKPMLQTASLLRARGATVRIVDVPPVAGKGTGIDDYLAHAALDEIPHPLAGLLAGSISVEDAEAATKQYTPDDVGNGERLADEMIRLNSHRYNSTSKSYIRWNGTYWEPDENRTASQMWQDLSKRVLDENAFKSARSKRGIDAAVSIASNHPGVAVQMKDLDQDPFLLNTLSGTVDLRTGDLQTHNPADLLTTSTVCGYDSAATAPTWDKFLLETFEGDQRTVDWMQKLAGMALIGRIFEEKLVIFTGVGQNGKSTILETFQHILGGKYSGTFAPDSLMEGRAKDEHLVAFRNKRLMLAAETGFGQILDEATLKRMTSRDQLTARDLYSHRFEFWPTHTSILATNHVPVIKSQDNGTWRRIVIVPFDNIVTEDKKDTDLPQKLKAEAVGILRWMVEGARKFLDAGSKIGSCPAIDKATAAYRKHTDLVGQFLEECCTVGALKQAPRAKVYEEFRSFCESAGTRPWTLRTLMETLQERNVIARDGYTKKIQGTIYLVGIGLRTKIDDNNDKISAEVAAKYPETASE